MAETTGDRTKYFLEARSNTPLPDTVIRLLEDAAHRCGRVHDLGRAHLIECDEASLAALIANDSRTRNHCMQAGKRHLVVPGSSVSAFKRNLCDLGYLLATGQPAKPKPPRPVKRIQAS